MNLFIYSDADLKCFHTHRSVLPLYTVYSQQMQLKKYAFTYFQNVDIHIIHCSFELK